MHWFKVGEVSKNNVKTVYLMTKPGLSHTWMLLIWCKMHGIPSITDCLWVPINSVKQTESLNLKRTMSNTEKRSSRVSVWSALVSEKEILYLWIWKAKLLSLNNDVRGMTSSLWGHLITGQQPESKWKIVRALQKKSCWLTTLVQR